MRVSDLYREVAQLGFEDSLESGDRFLFAANRALLQIGAIRPREGVLLLSHRPLENQIAASGFAAISRSEDLCFYAPRARAFYFECDGNGTAYIEREQNGEWLQIGEVILAAAGGLFTPYRGFVRADGEFFEGRVRLRFAGDFTYAVRGVAMYDETFSENPDDIPAYAPSMRYDVAALAPDFLSFCLPPIKEDVAYETEDGRILVLPREAERGLYRVCYKRIPKKIDGEQMPEDNDTELDLDTDLCALLPLLVAAYIWLEDEPSMAQYYLSLYRERVAEFEKNDTSPIRAAVFKDATGW